MSQLRTGMVVAKRYRVGPQLGEGGMSTVWEGTNLVTHGLVALKVQKHTSPEHLRRFLREARIAASLRHPHVATVHDVHGLTGDAPAVMVMERLVGETLAARISNGPLSLRDTAHILLAVVGALEHAHARSVVHRDVKPDNIFLTDDGNIKVLDFGIAAITSQAAGTLDTATGAVLGTAHYMAPEQLFGEKRIDHRADVWALGVVLYQCLTGRRPFEGDNAGQVFKAVAIGLPEVWEGGLSGLPVPIAQLIRRALVRDRSVRMCTLEDFRAALAPYDAEPALSKSIVARTADLEVDPYARTFASSGTSRRRRPLVAAIAALAMLIAGLFGMRVLRKHPEPAAPVARAEEPLPPAAVMPATAEPAPVIATPKPTAAAPSRAPRTAGPTRLAGGVAGDSPY